MLRVVGQTSRAVFLQVGEEIVWIAGPSGVRHRRAVVASVVPPWAVGVEIEVRDGVLRGAPELRLAGASVWRDPTLPTPGEDLGRGAQAMLDAVSREEPDSWGNWGSSLAAAFRRDGLSGVVARGKTLVGVGPGLTPFGDDLVGGALFGLRVVGLADPQWEDFLAWARPRTSRLSGCLLTDLAGGCGPEPLHGLAEALCGGQQGLAEASARRLEKLGQSTGKALLLGALGMWAAVEHGGNR